MSTQHTPGPWVVVPPSAEHPSEAIVCAVIGANIYSAPLTKETEANARLIADAPDLFRLLKLCNMALAYHPEGDNRANEDIAEVEALIRQVQGD